MAQCRYGVVHFWMWGGSLGGCVAHCECGIADSGCRVAHSGCGVAYFGNDVAHKGDGVAHCGDHCSPHIIQLRVYSYPGPVEHRSDITVRVKWFCPCHHFQYHYRADCQMAKTRKILWHEERGRIWWYST